MFKEQEHPRDKSGKFTSKDKPFDDDDDFENWDKNDLLEEISDGYIYGGLSKDDVIKIAAKRKNMDPDKVAELLADVDFDAYHNYWDEEEFDIDDKPYDFDKWAKETNSDKTKHAGYLDVNSSYDAGSILNYISNDPDWSISSNGGNTYLLKHKSGPVYSYNKDTQQISLTTEKAEQEKGKQAHTKEITDYIQDQIKKGATDPETIYQNSPYSIHSYDEMIKIANNLLKNKR